MPNQKKLTITRCEVSSSGQINTLSDSFEVMLNPSDYSMEKKIQYDATMVNGQIGSDLKFAGIESTKASFKILIDGTGVVRKGSGNELYDDVKTQLEKLQKVIYDYDGSRHQPDVVQISWGNLLFYGRCCQLKIDYKVFNSDGNPLRAEAQVTFNEYISKEEQTQRKNNSSPDMTHVIVVKSGDTLPLLCYTIYQNISYYREVAKINNITNFRSLKPGTKLLFPPLK